MTETMHLAVAAASFVGTHLLLSHPLRAPLVARMGEKGFLGLYSLVALVTLGWMAHLAGKTPVLPPYWVAPFWFWQVATLAMWVVCVLLVGSLLGNPAMVDPTGKPHFPERAKGVFAITRHPMMWSFTLWAVIHAALWGTADNLIVSAAIGGLAFIGSQGQDRKKARLVGAPWLDWCVKSSFWPFIALLTGRARWRDIWPGWLALVGGTGLWLGATWAHEWLGGPAVGPWMWLH
jgi:uncharacterized membrane protein